MNPPPDQPPRPPAIPEDLPAPVSPEIPSVIFTKVDNNLTSIGFFTASSKRSRKALEKTAILSTKGDIARKITILPSAKYGMPITQDQDYWLALMKLVGDHVQKHGKLINPFIFTTGDLHRILGHDDSGKNYAAVDEWLSVMNNTAIEGGTFNNRKKTWCIEKTHSMARIVAMGKELPDRKIADKNYIWFSEWQLDNINSGKLMPIELSTYLQLKTNIARILVPHLQEWLFASQRDGRFEKQYEDLCSLLGICTYPHLSDIKRKLGPSLNELVTHGYLSQWAIEPMADDQGYKLVLWHGAKFHRDRKSRQESKRLVNSESGESSGRRPRQQRLQLAQPAATPAAPEPPPAAPPPPPPPPQKALIDEALLAELVSRGVGEGDARKVLSKLAPEQPVMDQLEYADAVIRQSRGKIQNPQGFYISRLQDNAPNPAWFETSAARKIREEAEAALALAFAEERLAQLQAEENERIRMDAQIDALPAATRLALFEKAKAQLLASYPGMALFFRAHPEDAIRDGAVRGKMRQIFLGRSPASY